MSVIIRSATGPCQQMTTTSNGYPWQDGDILDAADLNVAFAAAYNNVGRNLIHNPLFNIAQRGMGPFNTNGAYTLDRWELFFALDTIGVQPVALADAQRTAIGDEAATQAMAISVIGNAGASAFSCVNQYIEGVRRLAGKTVTVSFWAYATTGSPKIGVAATQQFGSGGSPSADVLINGTATPALTNSPVRYSITFTYPSVAGKTLGTNGNDSSRLGLFFSCGATYNTFAGGIGVQSATFVLWGVQLEVGSVATPLEKPDPRYDLSNCQRFFHVGWLQQGGYNVNAGPGLSAYTLPVTMHHAPTLVPYFTFAVCTLNNFSASGSGNLGLTVTATATGTYLCYGNFTASADL